MSTPAAKRKLRSLERLEDAVAKALVKGAKKDEIWARVSYSLKKLKEGVGA